MPFALSEHIVATLQKVARDLTKENFLANLDPPAFCARAGYYLGELNAIHPFRDGNGRTQREVIRQLGLRSGYRLHWALVTRAEMAEASRNSFQRGDNSGLSAVPLQCLGE